MHACILDCGVVYEHVQSKHITVFQSYKYNIQRHSPRKYTNTCTKCKKEVRQDRHRRRNPGRGWLSPSMIVHGGTAPHTGTYQYA